jgi:DNA polymerase-3 subunit gamma/tau
MAVLYRKYRPQTFSEVLNQKYIIRTLQNQVKNGAISHAYLFTGSRGVGKTSVARILAKAVNCLNPKDGEACGACEVCKQIAQGSFLDLVEIDAASNTGIDNIRELIEHVKFSPARGKYKVFIIDEVHMLSKGAFNALLKTLEEPPKHAIFILATTEINKVPATIISRTQRFDFKAYSAADLLPLLEKISEEEKISLNQEILKLVAQNAGGSARDALSLLDKLLTLGSDASLEDSEQLLGITDIAVCESLMALITAGAAEKLPPFFEGLLEKGLDFGILNKDFLEYLRKALVFKIGGSFKSFGLSAEHSEKLAEFSGQLTAQELIFVIRLFLRSYKDLDTSPSAEIPLLLASVEAALRKSERVASPQDAAILKTSRQEAKITPAQKPPTAESVLKPVEEPKVLETNLTLGEVAAFWPRVLAKIKEVNSPLSSLLKNSEPVGVAGNKVVLEVKFLFNKQNLENSKNSGLISNIIFEISGKRLGITGQIAKETKPKSPEPAEVLNQALKVFGGELID